MNKVVTPAVGKVMTNRKTLACPKCKAKIVATVANEWLRCGACGFRWKPVDAKTENEDGVLYFNKADG